MAEKYDLLFRKTTPKICIDLSKKNPHDILHLIGTLKKLEKEKKIKIKKVAT